MLILKSFSHTFHSQPSVFTHTHTMNIKRATPSFARKSTDVHRVTHMKRKHDDDVEASKRNALTLPDEHPFSIELADSASSLPLDGKTILSCKRLSAGLVEVELKAGSPSGYGARSWPVRIGGVGIGDEPHIAAAIGAKPRGPVLVRFAVPIAMSGVDDTGCCDASFFDGLAERPSLKAICERATEWLSGRHVFHGGGNEVDGDAEDDDAQGARERQSEWRKAEQHCHAKHVVVETYRRLALCRELVCEGARLDHEWVVPALHGLLGALGGGSRSQEDCVRALLGSGAIAECAAGSGIYSFDLFTPAFCTMVASECDHFEATELPRRRPNTMNNQGLVINECGMLPLMDDLVTRLIAPLSRVLFDREAEEAEARHVGARARAVAREHAGGGGVGREHRRGRARHPLALRLAPHLRREERACAERLGEYEQLPCEARGGEARVRRRPAPRHLSGRGRVRVHAELEGVVRRGGVVGVVRNGVAERASEDEVFSARLAA